MENYNLGLLALSFLVAVFGSFVSLQLAIRIPVADNKSVGFWVISAGLALGGGGIWTMHFIGMLAMEMPFAMQFDLTLTILSFVVAVVFVSLGLYVAGKDIFGDTSLLSGGAIAGLGVSAMHYIGMYSMEIPAIISYDDVIVGISILIGVIAAVAALWLAFHLRGNLQRFGSAIIMGVAVCGMHYTGMYAATMVPNKNIDVAAVSGLSSTGLAAVVSIIASLLLLSILYLSYLKTKSPRGLTQ